MVNTEGTKGVKNLSTDFDKITKRFSYRIQNVVKTHNIPDSFMIFWDQTLSNYVPVSNCAMDFEGVKQIALSHNDDKRQMTFFLIGITKAG